MFSCLDADLNKKHIQDAHSRYSKALLVIFPQCEDINLESLHSQNLQNLVEHLKKYLDGPENSGNVEFPGLDPITNHLLITEKLISILTRLQQ